MLWLGLMPLGGARPPPEVWPGAMRVFGSGAAIRSVILLIQDAWLGFGRC